METAIGPLEMRVLGLLEGEEPRSVHEVQAALARKGQEAAYTTVMTVLSRLHQKGLVSREKEGNRYLYRAARRVPEVKARLLSRIRKTLFAGERLRPIAELVAHDLSREELAELKKLVDARLAEKKKR